MTGQATAADAHQERSFTRLITFIDAVVAIAITLLGLPLIDVANDYTEAGSVAALFEQDWSRLLAFLLSFTVIAMFWVAHHRVYDRLTGATPALIWVNILWLATIVFLPFPTELVANTGGDDDWGVSALYIGTILATALVMLWQVAIIRHHPEFIDADENISYLPSVVIVVSLALALVIGLIFPVLNLWSLFIVAPARWVAGMLERRTERRPASATPRP